MFRSLNRVSKSFLLNKVMRVNVVFKESVSGVAVAGEEKVVSRGYAWNFLLPKGIAVLATPAARREADLIRKREIDKKAEELRRVKEDSEALREREVRIEVKTKENGSMFGSVGAKDIVEALAKEGVVVPLECISLPKPLRSIGTHELEADFGSGVHVPFVVVLKGK